MRARRCGSRGLRAARLLAMAEECVFCAIVRGEAPAEIVYADAATMAFMDHAPLVPGHVLVIPKGHYRALWDLDDAAAGALMRTTVLVSGAVNAAMRPLGMNLFHSTGAAAGQSVFHVHVHVVPRNPGDRFRPPYVPEREGDAQLADTATRIRAALTGS
jgi:histidine triad (HIT) family protein